MKPSIKGIVIGGVADVVLSGVLGIPFTIYVIASQGLSRVPEDQIGASVVSAVHANTGLHALRVLIGIGCSVLGGYIAARISKQDHIANGVLASWLCLGVGVYSLASGKSAELLPLHLVLMALTPVCYWVGAKMRVSALSAEPVNA